MAARRKTLAPDEVATGYGFGAAAAILGISESRLRYWSQSGFIGPSLREAGKQAFSFQDLAAVKAAKELTDRGVAAAEVRRALDRVRTILPGIDRPLEHLRLAFDGRELVLVEDGAAFALSGQRVFDFGLGELRARATGWGRTTPLPEAETPTTGNERKHAYDWWQEGLRLEQDGRKDGAAAAYRRALKLDPGLGAAHTNLGTLAYARGDLAEARASFQAALAVDPEQPEAHYNLAHLFCAEGELELGAAELRRVLQLEPNFADAHYNLAIVLEALGGRRQAAQHLERYLELSAPGGNDNAVLGESSVIEGARARLARLLSEAAS